MFYVFNFEFFPRFRGAEKQGEKLEFLLEEKLRL